MITLEIEWLGGYFKDVLLDDNLIINFSNKDLKEGELDNSLIITGSKENIIKHLSQSNYELTQTEILELINTRQIKEN